MSAFANILQGFYNTPGDQQNQPQGPFVNPTQAPQMPRQMAMNTRLREPGGMDYLFGTLGDLAAVGGVGRGGNLQQVNQQAQRTQEFNVLRQLEQQRADAAAAAARAKAAEEQRRWNIEQKWKEREFSEGQRQFNLGGGGVKELEDGTLVHYDRSGNVRPIWSPTEGGLTPMVRTAQKRIQGTLNHLSQYAEDNSQLLEHALGPARGGESWASLPAQLYGSLTAAIAGPGGSKTTWEMRDAIAQKVETLAATMKPLIRGKGEGPWTDSDQERLVKLTGDLAKSTNAAEFKRRLKGVQDTINAAFGTNIKGRFGQAGKKPMTQQDLSGWTLK